MGHERPIAADPSGPVSLVGSEAQNIDEERQGRQRKIGGDDDPDPKVGRLPPPIACFGHIHEVSKRIKVPTW
jgi:hypothetical protein